MRCSLSSGRRVTARSWNGKAWTFLLFLLLGVLFVPGGAAVAQPSSPPTPVVVIGIPGLLWSDLSEEKTPHLWDLVEKGSSASLVVRAVATSTCPVPGWLTVSAGQPSVEGNGACSLPAPPQRVGDGARSAVFDDYAEANEQSSHGAQVGLLGQYVHDAGEKTAAIGPGGVLGAMDKKGAVDFYASSVDEVTSLEQYSLIAVDIDTIARDWAAVQEAERETIPEGQPEGVSEDEQAVDDAKGKEEDEEEQDPRELFEREGRLESAAEADTVVGKVLSKLPQNATILVAGLADVPSGPHLRVAMVSGLTGNSGYLTPRGYATSDSTRRGALVTLMDLTATATHLLDLPNPPRGSSMKSSGEAPSVSAIVERLTKDDEVVQMQRGVRLDFLGGYVLAVAGIYFAIGLALSKKGWRKHKSVVVGARVAAVALSATGVGTFLAQLVPWWEAGAPAWALSGAIAGFALLLTVVAFAGPWRRHILGPPVAIGVMSFLVLSVDVMTGAHLQIGGVTGYDPLSGARYYGFGNIAFAVFAASALVAMCGMAFFLLERGKRKWLLPTTFIFGAITVLIDVLPLWGSDFGGVWALFPAFVVFFLMVSSAQMSWKKIAVVSAAGLGAVVVISLLDWARGEGRSHLGGFVQQILTGDAWNTVNRKFTFMYATFGNRNLVLLTGLSLLFAAAVLFRRRVQGRSLVEISYKQNALVQPTVFVVALCAAVGLAVNDSGLAIPAFMFVVTVPLLAAVAAKVVSLSPPSSAGVPSEVR